MRKGSIQLHRKLMESDVWTCSDSTLRLMITCLFLANYQDQQWFNRSLQKPQLIPRGSFITTFKALAVAARLSTQKMRSALLNLSNTQFLTRAVTGRVTQITILKYNDYQSFVTRDLTRKVTPEQHVVNTSSTQFKEVNAVKSVKKEEEETPPLSLEEFVSQWRNKPVRDRNPARVAMGLKAYHLSFRVEEDIYEKIMGDNDNGYLGGTSIFEQAAKRRREEELKKSQSTLPARVPNLQNVPPQT